MPLLTLTLLGCLAVLGYHLCRTRIPNGVKLPPGPKGLPFLGLIRGVPHDYAWLTYSKWAKQFGPVVYLKTYGQPLMILNSYKTANALLEKRSAIYSGRQRMAMADELMGWDWDFLHMTYSERWRKHRRVFAQSFQSRSIPGYHPIIRRAALQLVYNFSVNPGRISNHLRHFASGIVLRIAYGYEVTSSNDEYVRLAQVALAPLRLVYARSYLVEYIPALKYIPCWFPGAKFKRQAKEWSKEAMHFRDSPFQSVKNSMLSEAFTPCMVSEYFDKARNKASNRVEELVRNCAGVAYAAGTDTTFSLLELWLLAMAKFPKVQERAYRELFSAMVLETLRWFPTAPTGVPHTVAQDNIYENYFIPGGTTVIVNFWAISRDSELYPDPDEYMPERFLPGEGKQPQLDPAEAGAFGFGRRICPGRHLGMSSAWLAMGYILALYEISPGLDENGDKFRLDAETTTGITVHPKNLKIQLTPRSKDLMDVMYSMRNEDLVKG
ncbi:Cytochrome P450 [Amanita muscaria]